MKKNKNNQKNLLEFRPRRLVDHQIEDQKAVILIPKFRSRWMGWYQRRLKKPFFQLHLDEVGTAVWLSCDGERTVFDIGNRLKDDFGEKVEPVWDRLSLYLRQMHKGKLIQLRD